MDNFGNNKVGKRSCCGGLVYLGLFFYGGYGGYGGWYGLGYGYGYFFLGYGGLGFGLGYGCGLGYGGCGFFCGGFFEVRIKKNGCY